MTQHLPALSTSDLKALALALRSGHVAPPYGTLGLQRVLPPNSPEDLGIALERLRSQGWMPVQIATLLETVASDRSARRPIEDALDLVTTGPDVNGIDNRDTSVVVRDLFAGATTSVLIAGYAIYQGQQVFQTLADRMLERPDLRVRIVVDIQRGAGDTSTAYEISRRFAERFRSQQWPDARPLPEVYFDPRSLLPQGEKRACMHAKCVVVDQSQVFISSANFTEAAQQRNIEVGLIVKSEFLAGRLTRFFSLMIADDSLQKLDLSQR
jgi:phosphatidylserine/phosphatidylglycerophosphate/cardiolipin synthase-like enzyme